MGTSDQRQRIQTGMSTRLPWMQPRVCQPASQEQQEKENALTLFSLVFPELHLETSLFTIQNQVTGLSQGTGGTGK